MRFDFEPVTGTRNSQSGLGCLLVGLAHHDYMPSFIVFLLQTILVNLVVKELWGCARCVEIALPLLFG